VILINEADLIINIKANIESLQQDILNVNDMTEKLDQDQYDRRKKLFDDLKALTQVSLADQIAQYEAFAAQYAGNNAVMIDVDRNLYALKKQLADQWLAEREAAAKAENDGTQAGYEAALGILKDAQQKSLDVYAQYPASLKDVMKQLEGIEVGMTKQREDAVLAEQAAGVDAQIAAVQRLMQVQKEQAGLVVTGADGSRQTLTYTAQDQAAGVERERQLNAARIDALKAQEAELTDAGRQELSKRLDDDVKYGQQLEDLRIQALKDEQAQEKAALEQAARDNLAIKQRETESYLNELKARRDAEVQAVDDAARAQTDALNAQLNALQDAQRAQAQASREQALTDDMSRLQLQLDYTRPDDQYNAYELGMRIAADQADLDAQRQTSAYDAQINAIREQIRAVSDAAAQQKQAIQSVYDSDVAAAKDALAQYKDAQNGRVDAAKGAEAAIVKLQAEGIDTAKKNQAAFLSELAKQDEGAQRTRRSLMQNYTDYILSDLMGAVSRFAQAGQAAGQAYAGAFAAATAAITQSLAGAQGAQYASASASGGAGGLTVNNTFNNPVQSPAELSRQIALTLEGMAAGYV